MATQMAVKSASKGTVPTQNISLNLPSTVRVNENLYRLSPNEEARILKENSESRRKQRLIDTRNAQKQASRKILAKNRYNRDKVVNQMSEKLSKDWEDLQKSKVDQINYEIYKAKKEQGKGREGTKIEKIRNEKERLTKERNNAKAKIRENEAIMQEKELKIELQEQDLAVQKLKQEIKEKEKLRANMVAKLGQENERLRLQKIKEEEYAKLQALQQTEVNKATMLETIRGGIVESDFIVPENSVEKETPENLLSNADAALTQAIGEQERIDNLDQEYKEMIIEKRAQAEVRGETAFNKMKAAEDVSELEKLSMMMNKKIALKMGREIGKTRPDWQRAPEYMQEELRLQEQYKMEQAFEKILPKDVFANSRAHDSFLGNKSEEVSLTGFETEAQLRNKRINKSAPKPKKVSINPNVLSDSGHIQLDQNLDLSETDTTVSETTTQNSSNAAPLGLEREFRQPIIGPEMLEKIENINKLRRQSGQAPLNPDQVQKIMDMSTSFNTTGTTGTGSLTTTGQSTSLTLTTDLGPGTTTPIDGNHTGLNSSSYATLNSDEKVLIAAGLRPEEFLEKRSVPKKTSHPLIQQQDYDLETSLNTSTVSNRKVATLQDEIDDDDLEQTLTNIDIDENIREFSSMLRKAKTIAVTANPNLSLSRQSNGHDGQLDLTSEGSSLAGDLGDSTNNMTSTTGQFENILDEVQKSKDVHLKFIEEIDLLVCFLGFKN